MRLIVIAHNIRSTHNVGSIFRTCEGLGIDKIYTTGYTPYPRTTPDDRPPYVAEKLERQIHKTALGAEKLVPFEHFDDIENLIERLKTDDFVIAGLEQTDSSVLLPDYRPPEKLALVLGEEVEGIPNSIRKLCDSFIEIPMYGQKESYNVSVATGIALYAIKNAS